MSGTDAPIEPHVLLKGWRRVHPFRRYTTLHEEQISWPINVKPVAKMNVTTTGHDKRYHVVQTSEMAQLARREPQYHIQDMEPHQDTFRLNQGGFVHADPQNGEGAFVQKQFRPDVDYLEYTNARLPKTDDPHADLRGFGPTEGDLFRAELGVQGFG